MTEAFEEALRVLGIKLTTYFAGGVCWASNIQVGRESVL